MNLIIFLGLLAVVLGSDVDYATEMFYATDTNNDGAIWLNEMADVYKHMDVNDDGLLTPEEFAAEAHPGSPPLDVESAFKFFDTRDLVEDGMLDESAVLVLFNGLDSNKDGLVTLTEYQENYSPFFDDDDMK